jgi:hypothetical protein
MRGRNEERRKMAIVICHRCSRCESLEGRKGEWRNALNRHRRDFPSPKPLSTSSPVPLSHCARLASTTNDETACEREAIGSLDLRSVPSGQRSVGESREGRVDEEGGEELSLPIELLLSGCERRRSAGADSGEFENVRAS